MVTTANLLNAPHNPQERAVWGLANRVDHDEIRNAIARKTSVVAAINMVSNGAGYTSAPSVTIAPPDQTGTTATATATYTVSNNTYNITLTLTNGGSGYTHAPAVTLSGGGGTGAVAQAVVNYQHLTVYPLDPIPENAMDQWFEWHEQTHEDMLDALNLPGSDQESLNFDDPKELEHWLWLHWLDHNSCRQALGI